MDSEDESERRRAAIGLGEQGHQEAIPSLVQGLRGPNKEVQDTATEAFIKLRDRKTVQELIPLLREKDSRLCNMALEILREVGADGVDFLLLLLEDEDRDVRLFAEDILGYTGGKEIIEGWIEPLNDPIDNVCDQVIINLGQLKDRKAISTLLQVVEEGDKWAKFAAIESLVKLGTEEIVNPLIDLLQNDELIRRTALEALGKIDYPKGFPYLVRGLKEADQPMKEVILSDLIESDVGHLDIFLEESEKELLLEEFFENLDEEDIVFNFGVVEVVGRFQNRRAITSLIKLLKDPDGLMKLQFAKV